MCGRQYPQLIKHQFTPAEIAYVVHNKERYLSETEAQTLYRAVQASVNPMLQYIIPMLILTGARKREVLDAKWAEFDMERRQ